jgi:hypothetical protein
MTTKISSDNIQAGTLATLSGGAGTTVYDTIAELPLSGNDAGDRAFVRENNRLYIWNGVGWFNIALLNQNPTITQGPESIYFLSIDGTPTTITLLANDPEGFPITWSYQVTGGTLGNTATIVQDGNVFTITPSTDEADVGEFSITFTASDGVNVSTATSTFELTFNVVGQAAFTTPGTYSWTAPAGVTSVCAVCVGAGGGPAANNSGSTGAGGGGLGWKNDIPVTPGHAYTVVVGAGGTRVTSGTAPSGGNSYFIDINTVAGRGGEGSRAQGTTAGVGGNFVGDGGGLGGSGGTRNGSTTQCGGGGGAGGYTGNGGKGGNGTTNDSTAGAGGGGGGGGGGGSADTGGAGGGVGIWGQGSNGAAGASTTADGRGGFGGSGGGNASQASTSTTALNIYDTSSPSTPGLFGGGAAGADNTISEQSSGASGAVRIIWGRDRAFPATNTQDL